MKIWNYSLWLSVFSVVILLITFLLPGQYSIFTWGREGAGAGRLFPVMFIIWATSLVAFAMNNIFADKGYIDNNLKMPTLLKYLPCVLGIPSFVSFIWFIVTWMKGSPML
jgi:hypothetical protein